MGTLKSKAGRQGEGRPTGIIARQAGSKWHQGAQLYALLPDCLLLVWLPVSAHGQDFSGPPLLILAMDAVCSSTCLACVGSMKPGSVGGVVRGTQKQQQADNW